MVHHDILPPFPHYRHPLVIHWLSIVCSHTYRLLTHCGYRGYVTARCLWLRLLPTRLVAVTLYLPLPFFTTAALRTTCGFTFFPRLPLPLHTPGSLTAAHHTARLRLRCVYTHCPVLARLRSFTCRGLRLDCSLYTPHTHLLHPHRCCCYAPGCLRFLVAVCSLVLVCCSVYHAFTVVWLHRLLPLRTPFTFPARYTPRVYTFAVYAHLPVVYGCLRGLHGCPVAFGLRCYIYVLRYAVYALVPTHIATLRLRRIAVVYLPTTFLHIRSCRLVTLHYGSVLLVCYTYVPLRLITFFTPTHGYIVTFTAGYTRFWFHAHTRSGLYATVLRLYGYLAAVGSAAHHTVPLTATHLAVHGLRTRLDFTVCTLRVTRCVYV